MKKYIWLIAILLVSYSSISQTVTNSITLTEEQAREVIKDLVRGDACVAEKNILKDVITSQQEEINQYVDNSYDLQNQNANLETIIREKDNIIELQDTAIESVNKSLEKQRDKTLFYKITTGIALLGCGYLLIFN